MSLKIYSTDLQSDTVYCTLRFCETYSSKLLLQYILLAQAEWQLYNSANHLAGKNVTTPLWAICSVTVYTSAPHDPVFLAGFNTPGSYERPLTTLGLGFDPAGVKPESGFQPVLPLSGAPGLSVPGNVVDSINLRTRGQCGRGKGYMFRRLIIIGCLATQLMDKIHNFMSAKAFQRSHAPPCTRVNLNFSSKVCKWHAA